MRSPENCIHGDRNDGHCVRLRWHIGQEETTEFAMLTGKPEMRNDERPDSATIRVMLYSVFASIIQAQHTASLILKRGRGAPPIPNKAEVSRYHLWSH